MELTIAYLFSGTGDIEDVGAGDGKRYAVNFPLRDGIDDENYEAIFRPVLQKIMDWYGARPIYPLFSDSVAHC